ncbi:hypothetical protein C8R41DRAFT_913175 [Lentinula lateritia]|uniref:Uncharacterized protein n=1 Tax=Lentinula lateritia TaxID=40482 RepID=A0ABQ8W035_9AGAR|nr:hypothetical protein C8R41DRAFT_913175 [Lentinula lateritia]
MSSGRSPLSITEEQPALKIGWPAISPRITALEGFRDEVLDEIEQRKLDRFKKRYELLQESLAAADMQHKGVSVQIERYEGLALGDTAIGHICTAFHGYAERDLSTTPKAISLDNNPNNSITDANLVDVSLIQIRRQEVFMDCTAASKQQTGEVGLLKGYFGLPHLNSKLVALGDNTKKSREAQYFVQEYSILESGFTAAGSSGAIVYTDEFAAVGMAVGHFVSLIPMCIVLPLDRLVKSVESAAGVELEFVPPIFEEEDFKLLKLSSALPFCLCLPSDSRSRFRCLY